MKIPRMAQAMGHIDDDLVTAAFETEKKTKRITRLKWVSAAACFAVLAIAGAAILPSRFSANGSDSDKYDKYKYKFSASEAVAVEWPWEYKTNSERFQTVSYNGREYCIKSMNPIGAELLGDTLGTCEAEGFDSHGNKKYTQTFDVRKINGVSEEKLVAAGIDTEFYVYALDDKTKPAAFGEVLELYGLAENLKLDGFAVCEGYDEKGYFNVSDDAYIWDILSGCRDAKLCEGVDFDASNRSYLTFTATSDALGVYKRVIYISEDGYFATNIFDYGYMYFIGEDAAEKIIGYAKNNSSEGELSAYALTVAGTLTEIGSGYVLIDDTAMCTNAEDGTVYKVYTDDIRIKRCIDLLNIEVGSTVAAEYNGTITENNEVTGAYALYTGTLVDGGLDIPE